MIKNFRSFVCACGGVEALLGFPVLTLAQRRRKVSRSGGAERERARNFKNILNNIHKLCNVTPLTDQNSEE